MDCTLCNEPISPARLKAMPTATLCIECASQNDVPRIKRYDDHTTHGDVSETYYTDNPAIDAEIDRLQNFNPHLVGSDDHFIRDPNKIIYRAEPPEDVDYVDITPVDLPPHQLNQTPTMGLPIACHRRNAGK